jgi:UDPglucose 6-dehydrogenase
MQVAMIGTGYVGLVSGACFSDFGHKVTCVDRDAAKIERLIAGEMPIFEPGLEDLVAENAQGGRLTFTSDLKSAVERADAVFIAVGTPSRRGDGYADLTYVYDAAREIADALSHYAVIITKSTVPVGTGREVERVIRERRPNAEFDVASNPEFLREGSAIEDFKRPDRIVVGTTSARAEAVMKELYRPLYLNETPILVTSRETSELIKYAANAFLAMKITFINEISDLCENLGADVKQVSRGIGLDGRIGAKFLHTGPGYGGSCFPKDTLALTRTAAEAGAPLRLVEEVVKINDDRKSKMAARIIAAMEGNLRGRTIAVLGLTFKPLTDDMREAPSLAIVPALQAKGARIRAFDPEGMKEAGKYFQDVVYGKDAYETAQGADALVILTEWNEFRALDLNRLRLGMKAPLLFDFRNIYNPKEMAQAGFDYRCLGRPYLPPVVRE